ncbi:putative signal transduction histidine kinase [Gottschalkia acidurici 9a]|uniref:histidine kinase n=1 Tax=Gottschalkia acidurici (strain ATCC 7906 / DSM 604 / BCRC 14475 / CIP 104303 / KCTC 5404 / NCIMB 10678 / 9a) TaxID=1128398 RepID=K0AYM0_GOTA9|nr:ATP-binding protein [Gottschalkia acidurici]AFS77867.1 putative signal transduction histidine kinase [Gottschalkia acidurici 9a]
MLKHMHEQEASYILESKKRCRNLGMDPNKLSVPQNIMSELELAKKKEAYKEILDIVISSGKKIIRSLKGTPILIGISDEKGYVLDTLEDETIKPMADKLSIKPGVQYIEEHVGTNVVTLTLEQDHPIQLIGTNHYHKHFHNSVCYGVPFHHLDNNKLSGTICIMTGAVLPNPFFLMILTAIVDTIGRELLLRKQRRRIDKQQELLYKFEEKQRELLEKDISMKDEFITLMTHEFKTPINVIYSAIQLIEHVHINKVPKDVRNLIGSIKLNTFRQLRLVNNLLDIIKLDSDQFKLNLKKIDIVFLTKLITESVKPYAEQKKINIYFKSTINSKNIMIDDEKYNRVILNLMSNAVKFTPEGESISVKIKENTNENTITVDVSDTGIGIPKEKYEKIFDQFEQVENILSRQVEGSGIGLAIVKMLIDIMEGEIQVDSELGVGSTFTITLPIKEGIVDEENQVCIDSGNGLANAIKVEFSDIYF